jgi:hypothetical protein
MEKRLIEKPENNKVELYKNIIFKKTYTFLSANILKITIKFLS